MTAVLDHLDKSNLLPPLMIIEVLARSSTVRLSAVKVKNHLRRSDQDFLLSLVRLTSFCVCASFPSSVGVLLAPAEEREQSHCVGRARHPKVPQAERQDAGGD